MEEGEVGPGGQGGVGPPEYRSRKPGYSFGRRVSGKRAREKSSLVMAGRAPLRR